MTTAIATMEQNAPATWNDQEQTLIKSQIAQGCSDLELQLFAKVCQRTGLDPFARQVYAIKRGDKMTIQTGIDGYRLMAARTGSLAGIDDAEYDNEETDHPAWAKVTVYRLVQGQRAPFTAKARWSEYKQDKSPMWGRMPYLMLGKCAEALALRKAFPAELSGIYTQEEMDQADVVDSPAATAPTTRQATARKPTLADLSDQIKTICKAYDISGTALSQYMFRHQYNSKTYAHAEKVLVALSDDCELAEMQLISLAVKHLLTLESLVAILRRRSGDMTMSYHNAWAAYEHNQDEWESVIAEEKAIVAA